MKADLQARGMDVRSIPVPPEAFRDQAEKRVRLGLLVAEVVQKHSLQAKPDQIRKQIEEFAQAYENPGEVIRHYFSDRNRLAEVEALVVEQNVVDWVLSKSQVSDKPLAFDELMAQQQG
jgi:trigger factor